MKTAKELVDQINAAEILSPHEVEDMDGMDCVTIVTTLNRDEHRWYALGTVVFKVGDEFFGVRGPVSLNSEEMGWYDVGVKCEAFEMKQVPSVTYERKISNCSNAPDAARKDGQQK